MSSDKFCQERVELPSRDALIQRRVTQGNSLPPEASRFFRLDKVEEREHFDAGFGIVIALSESVQLTTNGGNHHLAPGSTMLIPFSAGAFTLDGSALLARPPLP
jgi:mannose-6-phosphate isomerase class I